MQRLTVCVLLIATWCFVPDSRAQTLTLTNNAPPVEMSYNDLAQIIAQVRDLIAKSNGSFSSPYERAYESLEVADAQSKIELKKDFNTSLFDSAPSVAHSVVYQFQFDGAPVSSVQIRLGDSVREITISGTSRTSIEAISALIMADLYEHRAAFAGFVFRGVAGAVLLVLAQALILVPVFAPLEKKEKVVLAFVGIAMLVCLYVLPWDDWLAGTAVFAGDSSFAVRHSALISLVGTTIAIAGAVFAVSKALVSRLFRQEARPRDTNER
jgi:hypothetical protein